MIIPRRKGGNSAREPPQDAPVWALAGSS